MSDAYRLKSALRSFADCVNDMVVMQQEHNLLVHSSWQSQNFPFYRAIWTECAELLDHYGWKWWNQQSKDIDQVKLEIVDIWHFGLSMLMIEETDFDDVAEQMETLQNTSSNLDFRGAVENLARSALENRFDIECFVGVMNALPMTLNELYGIYKGKNVLNRFRQKHGYKEGTYVKMWDGREDNVHLASIVQGLDAFDVEFQASLALELEDRYRAYSTSTIAS